jgi:hypothetical protein
LILLCSTPAEAAAAAARVKAALRHAMIQFPAPVTSALHLHTPSAPAAAAAAAAVISHISCRAAHQRLVAHSEEVAFNDPPGGAAEQLILNQHLARLITFSRLSSFQRFLQQVRHVLFSALPGVLQGGNCP